MNSHLLAEFAVKRLWGHKTLKIQFFPDLNIIIGPNASGKTTIINLLQYILTGEIQRISEIQFEEVTIGLKAFNGKSTTAVKVSTDEDNVIYHIGEQQFSIPIFPFRQRVLGMPESLVRRRAGKDFEALKQALDGLVPAVWLPVSRRLPINEEDEDRRKGPREAALESVDECLSELLKSLQKYSITLGSKLSELRKAFQKHALENILYDKRHDVISNPRSLKPPTDKEKEQLLKAFRDVAEIDPAMEKRIDEHFKAAESAIQKAKSAELDLDSLVIIPLISRTKSMVAFAQELETKRQKLFAPLTLYIDTVNSFFNEKHIVVSAAGELVIATKQLQKTPITWRQLSSGEKQLLILLTQAVLSEQRFVVYVADEPELSLHVTWQEKLLKSLTALAGNCQLVVATHSPDIAGPFEFIVVDEAQDLGVSQLKFLAALGGKRPNSLFFAGDLGQRIFQQPFSWKSLGVDIRGRARTLHINYRTSHQIRMQTDRLLGPEVADVDGNIAERRGTVSVFNGPAPAVRTFKSQQEENDAIAAWLADRSREGVMPHEFGVFVRSAAELDRARAAVAKAGLPSKMLDEHVETTSGQISIGTMHLAKGLEFRAVVVMACDDEIIPLQSRIETVADDTDLEEVYNTERHLLYLACTRARDHLLVTGVEPGSEFLDDLRILAP